LKVIRRDWYGTKRADEYRLIPLGDIHLGNAACNEDQFQAAVNYIDEVGAYWIGMGDYCEFINMKDARFAPDELAGWIQVADLADLSRAQRDRFLATVEPIAGKCLGLVEGNHERVIKRHYERDIYLEIVQGIKEAGGLEGQDLAFGISGWLRLCFYRGKKRANSGASTITINVHHGFVGGRLAGAKALNMQRWLWNHDADLVIFGHSHNQQSQVEAVELLDSGDNIRTRMRKGVYAGTFLGLAGYAEAKGYFPLPTGHVEILLKPGMHRVRDRIRIIT